MSNKINHLNDMASDDKLPGMRTVFLIMAQYEGLAIIPAELVARDYFPHLDTPRFIRKVNEGDIAIPLVRIEASQKSAMGVHVQDLADYIDRRREAARKECEQLTGRKF